MRVHQILEAEPFDTSKIAQSGPVTDTATGVKVTPQGDGKFKLEYPDGRVETAKNELRKNRLLKQENKRLNKLQATQNKAAKIRNKKAQAQADKDLKDLKGNKSIVKGLIKTVWKGTPAGLVGTVIMQSYNGGFDEILNHFATLEKQGCNSRHESVRQSRWRFANQIAEGFLGIGAAAMTVAIAKLGAAGLAVFFTVPALGWLGTLIGFVALTSVVYVVTEWLRETPSGRRWLAEQLTGLLRDLEGPYCEARGLKDSYIADDTLILEEVSDKEIKADLKDVIANLPSKIKADLSKGLKQSKQKAS